MGRVMVLWLACQTVSQGINSKGIPIPARAEICLEILALLVILANMAIVSTGAKGEDWPSILVCRG